MVLSCVLTPVGNLAGVQDMIINEAYLKSYGAPSHCLLSVLLATTVSLRGVDFITKR